MIRMTIIRQHLLTVLSYSFIMVLPLQPLRNMCRFCHQVQPQYVDQPGPQFCQGSHRWTSDPCPPSCHGFRWWHFPPKIEINISLKRPIFKKNSNILMDFFCNIPWRSLPPASWMLKSATKKNNYRGLWK